MAVDRVRAENREMILWTPAQVAAFLVYARCHLLYTLFYPARASSLRIGELLDLRWNDIEGDRLHVRHTLLKQKGKYTLGYTKTTKGHRVVTLAPDTVAVLEEHRRRQEQEREAVGEAWNHPGHMFTTEVGTYLDQRNVLRTWHRL